MERPQVKKGDWIKISGDGQSYVDGYVIDVLSDGVLGVGYNQNNTKPIKDEVIWVNDHWDFAVPGPNGSYLREPEASIVKNGPLRIS